SGGGRRSVAVEDPLAVLLEDPAVPLVTAVHVARAQQRRLDAAVRQTGGGGRHDGLGQRGGAHGGGGGEGRRDAVVGQRRVPDGDLGVEHDVAVVLQERARDVPGGGLRGVGDRGDPDDPYAQGAGVHRHLHRERVAPGQRDDHQHVTGAERGGVQDGRREPVDAFQGGAERGGHDVDPDDAGDHQQVH